MRRRWIFRLRLRKRVIVTTTDGQGFSGVLFDMDAEAVVLRETEALGVAARSHPVPVDGELLILREDVAYIQVP